MATACAEQTTILVAGSLGHRSARVVATCESVRCVKEIHRGSPTERYGKFKIAIKDVPNGTTFCPDCGCSLVWKNKEPK